MDDDWFFCIECQRWHKPEAFHHAGGHNNTKKFCSFCVAKSIEQQATRPGKKRAILKEHVKKYRAGKLPPWMFS